MQVTKHFFSIFTILSALFMGGCTSLIQQTEPPHISITHLELVDVQLLEQQYALTIRIQNPNDRPLWEC